MTGPGGQAAPLQVDIACTNTVVVTNDVVASVTITTSPAEQEEAP